MKLNFNITSKALLVALAISWLNFGVFQNVRFPAPAANYQETVAINEKISRSIASSSMRIIPAKEVESVKRIHTRGIGEHQAEDHLD